MRSLAQHILRKNFEDSQLGRAFGIGIAIALPRTNERHNGEILMSRQNRVDKIESTKSSRQNRVDRIESTKQSQQNRVDRRERQTEATNCSGARQRVGGQSDRKGGKEAQDGHWERERPLAVLCFCLLFGRWAIEIRDRREHHVSFHFSSLHLFGLGGKPP